MLGTDSGGIPTGLYVMGALLVGVGGAILWLLFRRHPQAARGAATRRPSYDRASTTRHRRVWATRAGRASAAGPADAARRPPSCRLCARATVQHRADPDANPRPGRPRRRRSTPGPARRN